MSVQPILSAGQRKKDQNLLRYDRKNIILRESRQAELMCVYFNKTFYLKCLRCHSKEFIQFLL